MSEHLSDLVFDRLAIGGGDPGAAEKAHLEACAVCRARRAELEASRAEFAARFDAVGLAADALMRARAAKTPWWSQRWFFPVVQVTAAVLLVMVGLLPSGPDLRRKGDTPLASVFVLNGEARALMSDAVAPDARLAIQISPPGPRWVRILWSSAPKQWSALYPAEEGAMAWRVEKPSWLDRELVLDGAREDEELGVVACEGALTHEDAARMLERGGAPSAVLARSRDPASARDRSGLEERLRADCELERTRIVKR